MLKPRIYLAKQLALSLGLVALGAAVAWALSLVMLQQAAVAAGALPAPGTPVSSRAVYTANPLYQAAKTLQTLSNGVGVVGAVLVLAYGVADRFEDRVLEVLG